MARLPRMDHPGAWFHVMNRGIARRVVFPDARHVRAFLACLALAVRRGELEIHAYCILSNHFHLLVRSPAGRLSAAMGRACNAYVRWFNRRARRDGPLFRGRFRSLPVTSSRYRDILVRYIEHNPVEAGIVRAVGRYPHASAAHWACGRIPPWLDTSWAAEVIAQVSRVDAQADYLSCWGADLHPAERRLAAQRMRRSATRHDDLDDLVGAAPARVQDWMARKARLADGGLARAPVVDPQSVEACLAAAARQEGPWRLPGSLPGAVDLWDTARAGLLHDLAGLTVRECAARLGISPSTTVPRLARHRELLTDIGYGPRIGALGAACIARVHPSRRDAAPAIAPSHAPPAGQARVRT